MPRHAFESRKISERNGRERQVVDALQPQNLPHASRGIHGKIRVILWHGHFCHSLLSRISRLRRPPRRAQDADRSAAASIVRLKVLKDNATGKLLARSNESGLFFGSRVGAFLRRLRVGVERLLVGSSALP